MRTCRLGRGRRGRPRRRRWRPGPRLFNLPHPPAAGGGGGEGEERKDKEVRRRRQGKGQSRCCKIVGYSRDKESTPPPPHSSVCFPSTCAQLFGLLCDAWGRNRRQCRYTSRSEEGRRRVFYKVPWQLPRNTLRCRCLLVYPWNPSVGNSPKKNRCAAMMSGSIPRLYVNSLPVDITRSLNRRCAAYRTVPYRPLSRSWFGCSWRN